MPAYVSFGKFTMDADGLHTELKRGRGDNSEIEIVRVSAPFEFLGLGEIRTVDPGGGFCAGATSTGGRMKDLLRTKPCIARRRPCARRSRPRDFKLF